MKRVLIFLVLLLFLFNNGLAKNPETELFLLPDQGFIRVDTHLLLDISQNSFAFKLFPNAQITAVWAPKLAGYSLERTPYYTLVTVELEEQNEQTFILDLSYEGFLDGYHDNNQNLDSELLWFPVFDKPFANLSFKMTIPKEHIPVINYDTTVRELSSYSIFSWEVNDLNYPVILFTQQTATGSQSITELQEPVNEQEVSKAEVSEQEVSETEVSEAEVNEAKVSEAEVSEAEVSETEVSETEVSEAEVNEIEVNEIEVNRTALVDTITSWDEAVTNKDYQTLSFLLHSDFPNREQYLEYLMKTPIKSVISFKFKDIVMENSCAFIDGYLFEDGIANYLINTKWSLVNKQWYLRELKMVPIIDPELEKWINQLITAMTKKNLIWLDQHLIIEDYKQSHEKLGLIQFLITVNIDASSWYIQQLSDESYQLTLIAQEEETGARLGLIYSLIPEQSSWKITELKVIGFYP